MGYSAKQRKVNVGVFGAEEIAKELKEMEERAGDVLLQGAKAGGVVALQDAQVHCPVDTGRLRNSLKMNISKVSPTKAEISIDYDKSLRYGTYVELGIKGRAANPFLRNAIDSNIEKINEEVVSTIVNRMKK